VTPELIAAAIAVSGAALLVSGWRMEAATLPDPTTEGTDDGAEALPAEDL
jgi:hypothetical protein